MKIIAHERGGDLTWTFSNVDGVELYEPFAFLMRSSNNDLHTKGNSVRYMVYYYFMLAENAGLTENPRLRVTPGSMVPVFLSACRSMQKARYTWQDGPARSGTRASSEDTAHRTSEQYSCRSESLVIKLRVHPEVLAIINGLPNPSQRTKIPDSDDEESGVNGAQATTKFPPNVSAPCQRLELSHLRNNKASVVSMTSMMACRVAKDIEMRTC
ncbi:hypothetical protein EK21DRAFT_117779 [Setomelanomma holmii]|uniref:Uncharacterized protein n=1 Tax=Setomelanomma holmii TaxID=210430 RepID=A0A9P4GYM8_9PLEO|nr:hypothetical protein EK21DRAFT_117779 [Setomelanomma holmii]